MRDQKQRRRDQGRTTDSIDHEQSRILQRSSAPTEATHEQKRRKRVRGQGGRERPPKRNERNEDKSFQQTANSPRHSLNPLATQMSRQYSLGNGPPPSGRFGGGATLSPSPASRVPSGINFSSPSLQSAMNPSSGEFYPSLVRLSGSSDALAR